MEARIPRAPRPLACSVEALAANPRALALPRGSERWRHRRSRRAAFALDAAALARETCERLLALPGSHLTASSTIGSPTTGSPTIGPADPDEAPDRAREVLLLCDLDELEAVAEELPFAGVLLAAQEHLERRPAPPAIMGVLNVTPDSFSDGGRYLDPGAAIARGLELEAEGALWIDVGGESTRPGAQPVGESEETARVLPVVQGLAARLERARVSIDTTKAGVARAALDAGAAMVNDVSAGRTDAALLPLVAARGCDYVAMHAQGDPGNMQVAPLYGDPVADVARFLRERLEACWRAGVDPSRIVLDPGIGFGKRLSHNLALLRRLPELRSLGRPLLSGVSRKSFIAHLTGAEEEVDWRARARADRPQDRLGGTAAAVACSVQGGAEILRVHDVRIMAEAARVAYALALPGPEAGELPD